MVTHDFPPQLGGIASHVYELSKELAKLNNEIFVLAPKPKEQVFESFWPTGIHVFYVRENNSKAQESKIRTSVKLLDYSIRANLKLKKIIKNYSINIVHYHNLMPESLITKGIKKVPVVFTAHESYFLKLAEKNRKRLRFYLSHPDYIIAPSKELLETAKRYAKLLNNASYIPNGVDPNIFFPTIQNGLQKEIGIKPGTPIILSARRLEEKNGVEYIIKAMPEIIKSFGNAKLLIVGDGSQRNYLKELAKQLNIEKSITWVGSKRNSEMPKYYNLADVVVLPSLKEATSIAGLEAMACGKPLVGTLVGGIPDLIDDGKTGYLVPPRQPQKMARRIVQLLSDPKLVQEFGENARHKVLENFSWAQIANKTFSIYKSLIY
ncbi:MAG: glycosyltransferase family 4 protein [Candidatus Marinimicrobia bacterium]|nr:glycosyltransferase family 4 protein [Candidatus Neomarinimicrobiota bacterium]